MPRHTADEDEWDEGDSDGDQELYGGGENDDVTIACPFCKKQIYDDAERCPYCGSYIAEEDAPPSRKPWWIILGAMLCLFAVYRWIVG